MISIGDLATSLLLKRRQADLKSTISRLSVESTKGRAVDTAKHLSGRTGQFQELSAKLSRADQFEKLTVELEIRTKIVQSAFGHIRTNLEDLSKAFASPDLQSPAIKNVAEDKLDNALEATLASLNTEAQGRYIFAGANSETRPFVDATEFRDEIRSVISGFTSSEDIEAAIRQFFSDAGDYVPQVNRTGGGGSVTVELSDGTKVSTGTEGDTQQIRESLTAYAFAVASQNIDGNLSEKVELELANISMVSLRTAADGIIDAQARHGVTQAILAENINSLAREKLMYSTAMNSIVGVDQYEAISDYQAAENQLEGLYAITARRQKLSFMEFLR